MSEQAHPFELAGMDIGPYSYAGFWSFPSPDLAEKNHHAYQLAMADMPRDLVGGCGTCSHCGMAISNVHIVRSASGKRFGVGCDCVQKTGDKALGDRAKVEQAKHERDLRRARQEARREKNRQQWLARVCNDRGETNAQRLERESAERQAAHEARLRAATRFEWLAAVLRESGGNWCQSVAADLSSGRVLTGRALAIACDIYSKRAGRSGSKAYAEAALEFDSRWQASLAK